MGEVYKEYYDKALQALAKNNADYAVELLKACLEREPAFAMARELLHKAQRQKHGNKPVSVLARTRAQAGLALLKSQAKNVTEHDAYAFLARIEGALAQDPFNLQALELAAQVARRANLIDTAIRTYHEIISLDERHLASLKTLSQLYQNRGEIQSARDILMLAVRHHPQDPELANAIKSLDAMTTIARARNEDPMKQVPSSTATSNSQSPGPAVRESRPQPAPAETMSPPPQQTQKDRAAELKSQLERNPSDLLSRYQLGELLYESRDWDQAIQHLQQAVQHPRRRTAALNLLGLCFKNKGMLDLALSQFERAFTTEGSSHEEQKEILYNLGSVHEEMGQKEKALGAFKKIYEEDIGYRDVAQKVEKYYRA